MNQMMTSALPIDRSASHGRPSQITAEVLWGLAALLVIGLVGGLKLFTPFDGDQALFMLMAEAIDRGERLYADVWDLKQPGIFWFFWAGGKLFGFTMLGIKLFELAWMLALAATMILCLRRYFAHRWLGGVAAVAALATYYVYGQSDELTQIEMLVSFPMFLSTWCLAQRYRSATGRWLGYGLAGAFAGVVVVFKLPYAPIFVFMVLLAIVETVPGRGIAAGLRHALALLLPYAMGVAAVLLATAAVLFQQGTLGELLWISFVFPFLSLEEAPLAAPVGRLVRSLKWYAVCLGPWPVFAAVVVARAGRRSEPAFTRQLIAWIVLACLLIFVQTNAFWKYHFFLLFIPGAILAARGIDLLLLKLAGPGTQRPLAPALLSVFLVLPAMGGLVVSFDRQAQEFYQMMYSSRRVGLEGYRRVVGKDYGWVAEEFTSLRVEGGGEPIYVFGDPLVYLVTGRRQALPIHGWAWEMLPRQYWAALPGQLANAQPAYVFLGHFYRHLVPEFSPATQAYLDSHYDVLWDEESTGRLYRRRMPPPDGATAPSPGS